MRLPDFPPDGRVPGCDADQPPSYLNVKGEWVCRCMVCGRCGHHTGNAHQGHYWKYCKKVKAMLDDFHFCCPDLPCDETSLMGAQTGSPAP